MSVFRVLIPQTVFWGIFFWKCCHCLLTLLSFKTFLLGSMNFSVVVVCVQIQSKGFNYFSPNNCAKHRKWIISLTMSVRQNCIQFRLIFSSCSVTVSAVNVSVGVVMCHEFSLRLVWVNWPSLYWLHDPTTQSAFLKIISRNFEPFLLSSSMLLELTFFLFFSFYWHTQCGISDFSEFTNQQEFFMDILEYWIDIMPIRWKWLSSGGLK